MQTEYIENKLAVFLVLVNVYTAIDQGLDLTFANYRVYAGVSYYTWIEHSRSRERHFQTDHSA
jgi:hypothetical protein